MWLTETANGTPIKQATMGQSFPCLLLCLLLLVSTLWLFSPSFNFSFILFDDPLYVSENTFIQSGITWESFKWAFNVGYAGNWHPVTWFSHMLDIEMFGLDSGYHHLTNVIWHSLNAVLTFLLFLQILACAGLEKHTFGTLFGAFIAAAIFAFHPLRLESVIWISERKDVLSTFFLLSTLLAYIISVQRKNRGLFLLAGLLMCLGMAAKQMLVTVPLILLLLDYWPLGRYPVSRKNRHGQILVFKTLLIEKVIYIVPVVAIGILTFIAQSSAGAVTSLQGSSLANRIFTALIAIVSYVISFFYPARLSVFYPPPLDGWPLHLIIGSLLMFTVITMMTVWLFRPAPSLFVGWFWYVIMVLPVSGLVTIGLHSMADRYTYVTLLGLLLPLSYYAAHLASGSKKRKAVLVIFSVIILFLEITSTRGQMKPWRNTSSLFTHVLKVSSGNFLAHYVLSLEYALNQKWTQATIHAWKSVHNKPDYYRSRHQLGVCLAHKGDLEEAIDQYKEALELRPDFVKASVDLAIVLIRMNKLSEAVTALHNGLQLHPLSAELHFQMGIAYEKLNFPVLSFTEYKQAISCNKEMIEPRIRAGILLSRHGQMDEAESYLNSALAIDPFIEKAHAVLMLLKIQQGKTQEAEYHYTILSKINEKTALNITRKIRQFAPDFMKNDTTGGKVRGE